MAERLTSISDLRNHINEGDVILLIGAEGQQFPVIYNLETIQGYHFSLNINKQNKEFPHSNEEYFLGYDGLLSGRGIKIPETKITHYEILKKAGLEQLAQTGSSSGNQITESFGGQLKMIGNGADNKPQVMDPKRTGFYG